MNICEVGSVQSYKEPSTVLFIRMSVFIIGISNILYIFNSSQSICVASILQQGKVPKMDLVSNFSEKEVSRDDFFNMWRQESSRLYSPFFWAS